MSVDLSKWGGTVVWDMKKERQKSETMKGILSQLASSPSLQPFSDADLKHLVPASKLSCSSDEIVPLDTIDLFGILNTAFISHLVESCVIGITPHEIVSE